MDLTPEQFKDIFHECTLLKHARYHNEETIYNWKYIDLDLVRIYYLPFEEKGGFKFYVLKHVGGTHEGFDLDNTVVACRYEGIALHDGIRHLYMGSEQHDNYGYQYCPSMQSNIEIFKKLKELEEKHCDIQ